jgi:hypothetical protein
MSDVEVCKRRLDQLADRASKALRDNARQMAEDCCQSLSAVDLNQLETELRGELAAAQQGSVMTGDCMLEKRSRKLTVLEESLKVLKKRKKGP